MDLKEIVLPDGSVRKLGNITPTDKLKCTWREYGSRNDESLVPRDQWKNLITGYSTDHNDPYLPPIHNQQDIGQCCPEAATTAVEATRMIQGLNYVKLSAGDLYDRINGGSDNGSLLEDALTELTKVGVGTAATCGTLWSRRMTTASAEERARFKVLEFAICPTFDHCMSAILHGRKLISGIKWYSNYDPDNLGWLPNGRGQWGGHAIFGFKPAVRVNSYGIWHQNSWGPTWGLNGCFIIPEEAYTGAIGGWWAVREVTDEGGVIPGG